MRLAHPAHSEPEARECLRILQLQNPYSVTQGQQAPRARSGQLDFLHAQNLRLAQRAQAGLREESMHLGCLGHSGSEAQASVQNSRLALLGQGACSGQGVPRGRPAR